MTEDEHEDEHEHEYSECDDHKPECEFYARLMQTAGRCKTASEAITAVLNTQLPDNAPRESFNKIKALVSAGILLYSGAGDAVIKSAQDLEILLAMRSVGELIKDLRDGTRGQG